MGGNLPPQSMPPMMGGPQQMPQMHTGGPMQGYPMRPLNTRGFNFFGGQRPPGQGDL